MKQAYKSLKDNAHKIPHKTTNKNTTKIWRLYGFASIFVLLKHKRMTAKEKFLKRIEDGIKSLQAAYDANQKLPDSFFENIDTPSAPPITNIVGNQTLLKMAETLKPVTVAVKEANDSLYGANKKLVVKILKEAGKTLPKAEIIKQFEDELKTDQDHSSTVTNALAALAQEKAIIGHKPEGIKLKGFYWGLQSWFVNGKLKDEYEPKVIQNVLSRFE